MRRNRRGLQLPADGVRPLVVEQRQVAVGLHPARVRRPDQRLRGRTHRQRLFEPLPARLGHDRDLGREPLDELAFLSEHRHGHEQREVEVLVARGLDPVVERALDRLPDRVSVGLDHHRAADGRVLGQLGPANHLAVPAREVRRLAGQCVSAHRGAPASRRGESIEVSFVDVEPAFSGRFRRSRPMRQERLRRDVHERRPRNDCRNRQERFDARLQQRHAQEDSGPHRTRPSEDSRAA